MSFKGFCSFVFKILLCLQVTCNTTWAKTEETSVIVQPSFLASYYKLRNNPSRILRRSTLRFGHQEQRRRIIPEVNKLYDGWKLSVDTEMPGIEVATLTRFNEHQDDQNEFVFLTRLRTDLEEKDVEDVVSSFVLLEGLSAIFKILQHNTRVLAKVLDKNRPYWKCSNVDCSLLSYLIRRNSRIKSPLFVG